MSVPRGEQPLGCGADERRAVGVDQRELIRVRVSRFQRRHERQRIHGRVQRQVSAPRQDNLAKGSDVIDVTFRGVR